MLFRRIADDPMLYRLCQSQRIAVLLEEHNHVDVFRDILEHVRANAIFIHLVIGDALVVVPHFINGVAIRRSHCQCDSFAAQDGCPGQTEGDRAIVVGIVVGITHRPHTVLDGFERHTDDVVRSNI